MKYLLIAIFCSTLGACSFPGVYKINVQQGNIVTQDMLDKLKPGMTKRQVRFALGNSIVNDLFNDEEEVYYYSYQKAGGATTQQKITIVYKDGLYDRYFGDVLDEQFAY